MIPRAAVRPLALAAVVLTAAAIVIALVTATVGDEMPFLGALLALCHLGELAAAVAVVVSGAAGRGGLAITGLVITTVGQLGLAAAEAINITAPATAEPLYWFAPIVSAVGMIVLGIAVIRARVWDGAARALPLLVGLWMIVVVIPSIVAFDGPPALLPVLALAVWDLLWLGTAVAVLTHAGAATPVGQRA